MKSRTFAIVVSASMLLNIDALAQSTRASNHPNPPQAITTTVPRVMRVTTLYRPATAGTPSPVEGATLAIYRDEVGGAPLWQETQNMTLDADGHYTGMLGSTTNSGIPVDLFTAGEPRWLGIQFNRAGEVEQPRVLLGSVPYALRAADAESLGGHPATDYLLSPAAAGAAGGPSAGAEATMPAKAGKLGSRVTSGTPGYIAQFVNSTDLGNSTIFQNGGLVGVGTTVPGSTLDVQSATAGFTTLLNVRQTNSTGVGATGMTMTNQNAQMLMRAYTPGAPGLLSNSIGWFALNGSNKLFIGHAGGSVGNDVQLFTNNQWNNPQVTLTQAGNLGVGTTTPAFKFDVTGDINFTGGVRFQGTPVLQVSGTGLNANVGLGPAALPASATGVGNLGIGYAALSSLTTGNGNTAVGADALLDTSTSGGNTAFGNGALQLNNTGCCNVAIGLDAMGANLGGSGNIAIGYSAGVGVNGAHSNNIEIGSQGTSGDNGTIRIGTPNTQTTFFAAGIRGVTTGSNDAVAVVIDSNGQLGTTSSSRRFKEDIHDMGDASRNLMRLRPVTFRYRKPFADGSKPIQYGLIAEEVAAVYPDLVAHSADGQIETVKYQVLDSMLLNEMQKQHAEIQDLQRQVVTQQEENRALLERLERLEAALADQRNR